VKPCKTLTPRDFEITKAVDKKDKEVISDSSTTKPRSIHITFEATDVIGIDRLEFSLDGQAFSSCMGPVTYEKLRTSVHEFTAIAREEAGNILKDKFTGTVTK
jgi:hypothetical protein